MNRPFFPTTLSIASYDIGMYVGRVGTYQHPIVSYTTYFRAHQHLKFTT